MDAIKKTKGTYRLRIHLSSSEYSSLELLQQYKRARNLSIALGQAGKEGEISDRTQQQPLFLPCKSNKARRPLWEGEKKGYLQTTTKTDFGKKREGKTGPVFANP